tara:strand:+ start:378 stop:584 length:207 start_codon:yes stop_codon:yes gene_type:complete
MNDKVLVAIPNHSVTVEQIKRVNLTDIPISLKLWILEKKRGVSSPSVLKFINLNTKITFLTKAALIKS